MGAAPSGPLAHDKALPKGRFDVVISARPSFVKWQKTGDASIRAVSSVPDHVRAKIAQFLVSPKFMRAVRTMLDEHSSSYDTSVSHRLRCTRVRAVEGRGTKLCATFTPRAAPAKSKAAKRAPSARELTERDMHEHVASSMAVWCGAGDPLIAVDGGRGQTYSFQFRESDTRISDIMILQKGRVQDGRSRRSDWGL